MLPSEYCRRSALHRIRDTRRADVELRHRRIKSFLTKPPGLI
jgi:hypothetical protein